MRIAASARSSMASRSAAAGSKGTPGLPQWRKRVRAWASVVRLAVSAATERSSWSCRGARRAVGPPRRVLEVPHQRRGIEKADGGDAQAGLRGGGHALLEYQSGAK